MPEATPRPPIRVTKDSNGTFGIVAANGEPLAYARDQKHAAPIVRAVNSHDAIVAALERAQQDINWMLNNRQFLNPDTFDYLAAAIAKAQEPAR